MAGTKIEWTDFSWNPIIGCSKVSAGCENCYAERMAARLASMTCSPKKTFSQIAGTPRTYVNVVKMLHDPKIEKTYFKGWNGKTVFVESALEKPLHWKQPRMIFVNSMGDTFHPNNKFEWIDKLMAVIALCPQHTFQILTKRPEVMLEFTQWMAGNDDISIAHWPRNTWLGVTCENQEMADRRIPILLKIPAAKRFVSAEPLLEEIDFQPYCDGIDWFILGCESGPNRRPISLDAVYHTLCSIDSQADVFVKQLSINGKVSKNPEEWPEDLRVRQMPEVKG